VKLTSASSAYTELALADATAVTKNKQFKPAVCATSAGWRHDSRTEKGSFDGRDEQWYSVADKSVHWTID
jgi:hypothetical protein